MTIANTLPSTACQIGRVYGRFNANNNPVNTALKSVIVLFLCTIFSKIHSDATQVAIQNAISQGDYSKKINGLEKYSEFNELQTAINNKARSPKLYTPKILAGSNAIMT